MSKVERNNKEVYVYNSNNELIGYGGVSNSSPLSNFYSSEFFFDGHKFMFAESAIMYIKAITFNDHKIASKLLSCNEPKEAKRLGRLVQNFDPNIWVRVRNEKVPQILFEKFSQNHELKQWLLSTGDSVLAEIAIEGKKRNIRYKDLIWGIGIGPHHQDIDKPHEWFKYGENFLGKTLMSVRNRIKDLNE
jgi:ribA/ribD-fused uncharacterized protein